MNAKKPSAIESILSAARLNNTVIETIPFELNPKNEDEAYMAQNRLKNILVSNLVRKMFWYHFTLFL